MTADLAAWLLAVDGPIVEDERVAQAANPAPWRRITDKDHLDPRTIFGADQPGGTEKLRNVAQLDLSWEPDANGEHIIRWDPARVLAECAAKRAIIAIHSPDTYPGYDDGERLHCVGCYGYDGEHGGRIVDYPCRTLLAVAQPYASHEG